MTDHVVYLSALALNAMYPSPSPLGRDDAAKLLAAADEMRRLRAELERKEEPCGP